MSNEKEKLAKIFTNLADAVETGSFGEKFTIGLTVPGSEHGEAELVKAAKLARDANRDLEIVLIGGEKVEGFKQYPGKTLEDAHKEMELLFKEGAIQAAVTMHYNFPMGVATVGKVITPGRGKEMILSTTTGTADANRYKAMLLNVIGGIAVAKANGIENPTVGLLNIDGIALIEKALNKLAENGYKVHFTESQRADGGVRMRGNDLLEGTPDVMVCDTLTGNLLVKLFSSFLTGGSYEANGYGYGPCVGMGYDDIVGIVSRASGAPVIAKALSFVASSARGKLRAIYAEELKHARKCGLDEQLENMPGAKPAAASEEVAAPPKKTVSEGIPGIDVIEIEDACKALWKAGIYAESGMGCTGPVVMVNGDDKAKSLEILKAANFI